MPFANCNGVRIHYEIAGSGPPLLFIHGLGSAGADWEPQVKGLSNQFQPITYDVRGHGESEKPSGPYSVPMFARDAVGLLEHLGIESAHVCGLSMGGMIGFQLALDFAERVRSLTILNSGPEMVLKTPQQRRAMFIRYTIVRLFGMRAFANKLTPLLFPKPDQTELRRAFTERIAANHRRSYLSALNAINGWSVMERIGAIRCPVLVVSSDQDYTPVSWKEEYVRKIPDAQLKVLKDSRHVGSMDQAVAFNAILNEFLLGVNARSADRALT